MSKNNFDTGQTKKNINHRLSKTTTCFTDDTVAEL